MVNLFTSSELNESGDDDEDEGEELGEGEDVLDEGRPLDFPTVDKCQQACKKENGERFISSTTKSSFSRIIIVLRKMCSLSDNSIDCHVNILFSLRKASFFFLTALHICVKDFQPNKY